MPLSRHHSPSVPLPYAIDGFCQRKDSFAMPHIQTDATGEYRIFQATTFMPVGLESITRFHAQRDALMILTPPPLIVPITRDQRSCMTAGEVDFVLWFGPIPVRWLARHEPGPTEHSFIDRMIVGPLATWEHQHIFHAVAGSVQLVDKVTMRHKPGWRGWLSRLIFDGPALRVLFWYRHWRTQYECRKLETGAPTRA
jgi:ligand-binding SRPBCC domain-containing protein